MNLTEFNNLYENDPNFKELISGLIGLGKKFVKITNFISSDFSKDKHEIDGLKMTDIHKIFIASESSIQALISNEANKIIQNYLQKEEC